MATRGYINYRSEYKYQLANSYAQKVAIKPASDISTEFINLDVEGNLLVKRGYAWDGPSGPVIDREENMRASLVHDALYQLMRNGDISSRTFRKSADSLFKEMCIEDGISHITASAYYRALRRFGKPAASPMKKKTVFRAPDARDKT